MNRPEPKDVPPRPPAQPPVPDPFAEAGVIDSGFDEVDADELAMLVSL